MKKLFLILIPVLVVVIIAIGAAKWCRSECMTDERIAAEEKAVSEAFANCAEEEKLPFLRKLVSERVLHIYSQTNGFPFRFAYEIRVPTNVVADLTLSAIEHLPEQAGKTPPIYDFALMIADTCAAEKADLLRANYAVFLIRAKNYPEALAVLGKTGHNSTQADRLIRKTITVDVRAKAPDQIIPFFMELVACPYFRPADYIGQLTENQIIRFAGNDKDKPNAQRIKELIAFSEKLLPLCTKDGAASLTERRLDAFFLVGDYDSAITLLESGKITTRTPLWCKGTAAKLRAHKAMDAKEYKEAIKQLQVFGEFMLSDEQKDFEDCDPTTGIYYSREWVVARNFMRCSNMSRELGDTAAADKYKAEAKKYFTTALEKAKEDKKSLAALKEEVKPVGL